LTEHGTQALDLVGQIEGMIAAKQPTIMRNEYVLDLADGIVIEIADRVVPQKAAPGNATTQEMARDDRVVIGSARRNDSCRDRDKSHAAIVADLVSAKASAPERGR